MRPPAAPALALDVRQEFIHAPRPEGTLRVVTCVVLPRVSHASTPFSLPPALHPHHDCISLPSLLPLSLRYNTLAEPFATSDYALGHMFAYCPAPFLATEHRLPRVLAELVAYDAGVPRQTL